AVGTGINDIAVHVEISCWEQWGARTVGGDEIREWQGAAARAGEATRSHGQVHQILVRQASDHVVTRAEISQADQDAVRIHPDQAGSTQALRSFATAVALVPFRPLRARRTLYARWSLRPRRSLQAERDGIELRLAPLARIPHRDETRRRLAEHRRARRGRRRDPCHDRHPSPPHPPPPCRTKGGPRDFPPVHPWPSVPLASKGDKCSRIKCLWASVHIVSRPTGTVAANGGARAEAPAQRSRSAVRPEPPCGQAAGRTLAGSTCGARGPAPHVHRPRGARAAEHQPGQRRAVSKGARRRALGAVTPEARDEVAETGRAMLDAASSRATCSARALASSSLAHYRPAGCRDP